MQKDEKTLKYETLYKGEESRAYEVRPPLIVFVDTKFIFAHYIPSERRIEISRYLDQFPELREMALQHEIEHSSYPNISLKHITHEYRDRWKLCTNTEYFEQIRQFEKLSVPKSRKMRLFLVTYNILTLPTAFFFDLGIIRLYIIKIGRWIKRNVRQKES